MSWYKEAQQAVDNAYPYKKSYSVSYTHFKIKDK